MRKSCVQAAEVLRKTWVQNKGFMNSFLRSAQNLCAKSQVLLGFYQQQFTTSPHPYQIKTSLLRRHLSTFPTALTTATTIYL